LTERGASKPKLTGLRASELRGPKESGPSPQMCRGKETGQRGESGGEEGGDAEGFTITVPNNKKSQKRRTTGDAAKNGVQKKKHKSRGKGNKREHP